MQFAHSRADLHVQAANNSLSACIICSYTQKRSLALTVRLFVTMQNLGSLEQVALEIDGGGGLSPGSGYGSGGGFGSTGGSLTTIV